MLRLIQPKKSKIPVSGVFFTTGSFSPHLMLSTIQTQFLSNRMIIFSAFTKCLHTYTKLSIQSISISKYNPYSTWTKSRHEELGCLTLTRTTGQTIQPLDNTHERHQISTTESHPLYNLQEPMASRKLKSQPTNDAPCLIKHNPKYPNFQLIYQTVPQ